MTEPKNQPKPTQKEEGRALNVSVVVHTERGNVTYQRGETPKAEHAELITNPDVWA